MNLLSRIKKIAVSLEKKNNALFRVPVSAQKSYLEHFREPSDLIERSFFQYKCQMRLYGKVNAIIINIVSLPLLIFYYVKKNTKIIDKNTVDAVFISEGIPFNVVPASLKKQFGKWHIEDGRGDSFTEQDKKYFKMIVKKHPLSWHYLLKSLLKIRFYSYEISKFSPQIITVCGEYSFTSSLLTDYCYNLKILHVNVMHGEKLYFIRDSFFSYDKCYVWNDYYKKLFIELRADPNQFCIEVPESLFFTGTDVSKNINYTYYLGAETGEKLVSILKSLQQIAGYGNKVAIRPHPRYTDINELARIHGLIEIEDFKELTIEESLMRTENAISLYSTVLNQAVHNNVSIVIDDVTDPAMYKKLVDLKYVILKEQHSLLSDVVKEQFK